MERPVRILAAMFATACFLLVAWLLFFSIKYLVPQFPDLRSNPKDAAILGVLLGYWILFAVIYGRTARLIWQKIQWKKAMFFAALGILGLPMGPILGPAALFLLTRPAVRARFTS